jgi:repressor LexA
VTRASFKPEWANGLLNTKKSSVFSIPVVGMANCGPAEIFAEQNIQGFLRVSSKLTGRTTPPGVYAVKTDGSSMNRAEFDGRKIENGDYVIIDSERNTPSQNDVVLAIIDDKATIKRYIEDKPNNQIVLMADSSYDYEPIYLHSDDDFSISGKVISVIKKPNIK